MTVQISVRVSGTQRRTVKVHGCWLATLFMTVTLTHSVTCWVVLTHLVTGTCSVTMQATHTFLVRTSGHGSPQPPCMWCLARAHQPGEEHSSRHSQWPMSFLTHSKVVTGLLT